MSRLLNELNLETCTKKEFRNFLIRNLVERKPPFYVVFEDEYTKDPCVSIVGTVYMDTNDVYKEGVNKWVIFKNLQEYIWWNGTVVVPTIEEVEDRYNLEELVNILFEAVEKRYFRK